MRWKLFSIQNPNMRQKETYGFNTSNPPPPCKELMPFEKDVFAMVKNIQFRTQVQNKFQSELKESVKAIQKTAEVIVKADKSRNLYKVPVENYKKLLINNCTSDYKKTEYSQVKNVNKEASKIAKNLDIADRVDQFIEAEPFLTVKDHKESFPARVECRLINPSKSKLGKVSKQILSKVVSKVKASTSSNQWNNSHDVISWFNNLDDKRNLTFLKFDIVSFYPSISQELFDETIEWTKQYYDFSNQELNILNNARKSFLFLNGEPWTKKKNNNNFDVTMGSFDGAELCELVGLYILSKMEKLITQDHIGLYRDDGLAVIKGSGPEIERLKKKIYKIFQEIGLRITLEGNITKTDFLDVFFDLETNTYKPYRKKNETPVYINIKSNHPTNIKRELPKMIANRVSNLSCNEEVFNIESIPYQEALRAAGYPQKINFSQNKPVKAKNNRSRRVIWFNPPFSETVKTNVAAKFLTLIDKHFGNSELKKYFNRSTVKVSYSCLPNIESIISGHNKKILNSEDKADQPSCNCRGGISTCPMEGKCLNKSIIYKASVKSKNKTCTYLGLSANTFKERLGNHKLSFNHQKYSQNTNLSKHIWDLKTKNEAYEITWSRVASAPLYNPRTETCKLCNLEKTLIMTSTDHNLLNGRNELMNKCRHRAKFLLSAG